MRNIDVAMITLNRMAKLLKLRRRDSLKFPKPT